MKRSKWKGLFTKTKDFKKPTLTHKISRNSFIIPKFIDQTFRVYTGNKIKKILISKEMLGHKFGEFARTRATFEYKKKKKKKKK